MESIIIDKYEPIRKKYQRYTIDSLRNILKSIKYGTEEALVINHIILKRMNNHVKYYSRESKIQLERERKFKNQATKIHFGYKNESYHTEEEMINGFSCTYEDLSEQEKEIYDTRI